MILSLNHGVLDSVHVVIYISKFYSATYEFLIEINDLIIWKSFRIYRAGKDTLNMNYKL